MQNKKNVTGMILMFLIAVNLVACGARPETTPTEVTPLTSTDASIVSVTGMVVPEMSASLSVATPGLVEDVFVSVGQSIAEGQKLMVLSGLAQNEAALAAAQLELATTQQTYDDFVRNTGLEHVAAWQVFITAQAVRVAAESDWAALTDTNIDDQIADRVVEVQERKTELDDAQEEFDKYQDLDNDNAKRKNAENDLEAAQKAYNQAVWDLEETTLERDTARAALDRALVVEAESKRKYEITRDGPDAEQLALLEARLTHAKAYVTAAQAQIDNLSLLAPFAGTIADVNITPGEWASPGQPVLLLADLHSLRVETTDLNEVDVAKIHLGDVANISFDALPGVTIAGVVTSIAPKASTGSGANYTVVIELNEIPELLRWGMTAFVDIELQK